MALDMRSGQSSTIKPVFTNTCLRRLPLIPPLPLPFRNRDSAEIASLAHERGFAWVWCDATQVRVRAAVYCRHSRT